MDEGLFRKHLQVLHTRLHNKEQLLSLIKESTGVTLLEEEVGLEKKQITLFTSSTKKNTLLRKGLKDILASEGYSLT